MAGTRRTSGPAALQSEESYGVDIRTVAVEDEVPAPRTTAQLDLTARAAAPIRPNDHGQPAGKPTRVDE